MKIITRLEKMVIERCFEHGEEYGRDPGTDGCSQKETCICKSCPAITVAAAKQMVIDKLPVAECGICHEVKKIYFNGQHLKMCEACQRQTRDDDTPAYCYQERGCFCIDRTRKQQTIESNDFGYVKKCGYALGECESQTRTLAEAQHLQKLHLASVDQRRS